MNKLKINVKEYNSLYSDDNFYTKQDIRHNKIHQPVNCFFCNRNVKYKYDVFSPEEAHKTLGLDVINDIYICSACQCQIEFKIDDFELDRDYEGYDVSTKEEY